jgi:hypothetical protein
MRNVLAILFVLTIATTQAFSADNEWYSGDERCPPPKENGTYSAPYNAKDNREYPTFEGADKHGWSCSYQRDDGVIVQYGDSRTPQEQWQSVWGSNDNN